MTIIDNNNKGAHISATKNNSIPEIILVPPFYIFLEHCFFPYLFHPSCGVKDNTELVKKTSVCCSIL